MIELCNVIFHEKKKKTIFLLSIFLIATVTISMMGTVSAKDITIGPETPGGIKKAVDSLFISFAVFVTDSQAAIFSSYLKGVETKFSEANVLGYSTNAHIKQNKDNKIFFMKSILNYIFAHYTNNNKNFNKIS